MDDDAEDYIKPDLGLSYLAAGRGDATFTFTRLGFSMIARVGDGMYTVMSTLAMEQTYALSIDFDTAGFQSLVALLPAGGQQQLKRIFAGPFRGPQTVDVPPGAIVAGVRAKLGEPQHNDDESYVPFVAVAFMTATEVSSLSIKD